MEIKIPGSRILIQPTEPIRQLPSGLWLPETAVKKPNTGTVVVIGTECDPSWQDKLVLYNPIIAVEIDGKHLVHIRDIRAILA